MIMSALAIKLPEKKNNITEIFLYHLWNENVFEIYSFLLFNILSNVHPIKQHICIFE